MTAIIPTLMTAVIPTLNKAEQTPEKKDIK